MLRKHELEVGNYVPTVKAQELRIGNWVYMWKRQYRKIDCLDIRDQAEGRLFKPFEPIPLTPEILEKAGFKYLMVEGISRMSDEFEEREEGDTHNWTLNVKQSHYCDSFRFELVKWGEQSDFTFAHQWLRIRFRYVHQLQNLYFSLTGEELKIELN